MDHALGVLLNDNVVRQFQEIDDRLGVLAKPIDKESEKVVRKHAL